MKAELLCEHPRIELYQGDCLEILPSFPDKSFDLVLTDPPYGIGETNERNLSRGKCTNPKDYGNYQWDFSPMSRVQFEEIVACSKNQIIFGGNFFDLPPSSCWIVWDKENGASDFADCELAWTSFESAVRIFRFRWQGMLQGDMKNKEIRKHPTQKPTPLFKWILKNYSKAVDLILDPFAGSGTTGVAAYKLNRNCTMIELEPKYCDIIRKRIDVLARQERLFD